ncbi:MAG: CYTH domain-containing protein [Treponema sp.]|jgi:adenylate cyclase class 2|nr:CYTH domain-containing protein [Treponema sp.]
MVEIELKARVGDPQKTKAVISSFARYIKTFDKEDTYWRPYASALPAPDIRIRRETDYIENAPGVSQRVERIAVTYKTKEARDCIEVNNEKEFSISEGENEKPFEELLATFGLRAGVCKRKIGWAWLSEEENPPIAIELSEVVGLGWFVELEILSERNDEETVTVARSRLLACLGKTGVGEDKIEMRYYTDMLREKANTAHNTKIG